MVTPEKNKVSSPTPHPPKGFKLWVDSTQLKGRKFVFVKCLLSRYCISGTMLLGFTCFILLNPHDNPIMYVLVFSQFSDKDIKAKRGSVSKVIDNKWQSKIRARCWVFSPPIYSNQILNSYSIWLENYLSSKDIFHTMPECFKWLKPTRLWYGYISGVLSLPTVYV